MLVQLFFIIQVVHLELHLVLLTDVSVLLSLVVLVSYVDWLLLVAFDRLDVGAVLELLLFR